VRADFSQAVCRVLANRVGLHCSNPDCRAYTTGPKMASEAALNLGVAAHITAASAGGPRYAAGLSNKQRRSAANGIWLCQTCAKLIDNDESRYAVAFLEKWKLGAESDALKRAGKTNVQHTCSARTAEANLRRNHRLRDELMRGFLKTPGERISESRGGAQYRKFRETEFIVHRLGDTLYPESDTAPGISNWFKLEVFDFYFNGIEGILNIEYVLATEFTRSWSLLPDDRRAESFPEGFWPVKVFKTGRIPWRNIRHYDLGGDEYHPYPHLYCLFADNGMPYESFEYYAISEGDGYHFGLQSGAMVDLERLLSVDPNKQNSWEPLR
jgi:hypothetical protein